MKLRKRRKERESPRHKREQESIAITWLTERGAKTLRSVAAFLCGAEWIDENVLKWSTRFGKNLPIMGSEMWYVFDFSWKLLYGFMFQSGLKLYDLTFIHVAARVQMYQFVIAPFAQRWQRSHRVFVWSKWKENYSFNLNDNFYAAHWNKTTEVRNIRIHRLTFLNANHKTQTSSV